MKYAFAAAVIALLSSVQVSTTVQNKTAAAAISETGLLPIYGVDLTVDLAADDAAGKAWPTLAPLGFGVVRFSVDVRNGNAAGRVAQLCVWAAENGVKLVPVLTGAKEGEAIGPAFAAQSAGFVTALFQSLRGFEPSRPDAYQQVLAFQIERAMNDATRHGNMPRETALLRLLQTAGAIRKAEQAFIADAGLNATPLMIEASFDAELKAAGVVPLTDFTDAAYASALAPLAAFVSEAAASADIDLIALEYLPGTAGAVGTAADLARLVRDVAASAPGKKIVAGTGSSVDSAFPDDRKKFYALAFANLADHRASEGPDSALLGVIFRWADDEDAMQALAKIAESVSQANASTPPAEQVPEAVAEAAAADPASAEGGGSPMATAAKEKVQQFLLGLLDRSLEKLSTNIMSSGDPDVAAPVDPAAPPVPAAPADPAAVPELVITEMTLTPSKPIAGKPVQIDVLVTNKSETAAAEGLTAALVDDTGGVLNADTMPTDLLVPPADNRMLHLTWLPLTAGPQKLGVVIADASLNELAKSSYTTVAVAPQPPLEIAKTTVPSGSSSRLPKTPLGFPVVTQLKPGVLSQVIVSMRNPYRKPLTATSITLSAPGLKPVTMTMPYMAPGQTRSLNFTGMAFSGAGEREMQLTMKSGKRSTTLTSRMLLPAAKPVMAAAGNRQQSKTPVRSVLPSAPSRAVTPPQKPVMTPGAPPPPPIRATPEKAAPPPERNPPPPQRTPPQRNPPPPILVGPERASPPVRVARPDLAIVGANASSQATRNGQVVTVKVEIRNLGNAPAQGGQLACGAGGPSRSAQALGVIAPGQTRVAMCQVQVRSAGAVQIAVAVSAPGDANGSNNRRVLGVQPARRR